MLTKFEKNKNPSQKLFLVSAYAFSFWIQLLSLSEEGGNKISKDPVFHKENRVRDE